LSASYICESYAWGEAADRPGADIPLGGDGATSGGLSAIGGLPSDFEEAMGMPVGLVAARALWEEAGRSS
jgi:8-oxo-dGTP pyrophosphatase MutT (NUDIX family)